jgi:MFS family permease
MSLDLILLSVSLFIWGIGEGMFFYFQPIYLKELGADPLVIGAILGAAGIAMTVAHIPAGYLSDRFGRRLMLWVAWSMGLVSAWLMALARSLPLFVTGLLLYSLTAFVASPLDSYITAARGKWSVGRALTLISATFNLGSVLGPVSGGWLADRFGLHTIYLIAACIFILSTALIFFLHPQPVDGHDPDAPPGSLFSNWHYLAFLAVAFLVMFALYLPQPFTPVFLEDVRGLSLSYIGWLGTAGMLGNAVLSLLLGQLSTKLGFLVAQLLAGSFALLIWRGEGMAAFAIGYFLLGGYRAARSLASALVQPLVHQTQMGLAYGLIETINALPLVMAPPLAGFLYSRAPASIFPVSLVTIALGLIVSFVFSPRGGDGTVPVVNQPPHPF